MAASNYILQATIWSIASKLCIAATQVLTLALLSRLLSPNDFAVFQLTTVLIAFTSLADIGICASVTQKRDLETAHISNAFWLSILSGTAISFALLFSTGAISASLKQPEHSDVVFGIAMLPLVQSLGTVQKGLLIRDLKLRGLATIESFSYILGFALASLVLAINGYGYWSLVIGQICQITLRTFLIWLWRPIQIHPSISPRKMVPIAAFASQDTINNFLGIALNSLDFFFISRFLPTEALGFYNRGTRLTGAISNLFADAVDRVSLSSFSRQQDDLVALKASYLRAEMIATRLLAPSSLFCLINADFMVLFLLGPGWEKAIPVTRVMSLGLLFKINYKITYQAIRGIGLASVTTRVFVEAILLAMLLLFFFSSRGIAWVAGVVVVSMAYRHFRLQRLLFESIGGIERFEAFKLNWPTYKSCGVYLLLGWIASAATIGLPIGSRFVIQSLIAIAIFMPLMNDSRKWIS